MNYSLLHVEKYGHGQLPSNRLNDDKKVVIQDHDGYFDVYECKSDAEAEEIASWYLSAGYESYPAQVEIERQHSRYYSIEVAE